MDGIETSLRRIAHYDYWNNKIRRSVLVDSKADILVYEMGEKPVLELAKKLKIGGDFKDIRGICYISSYPKEEYLILPSYKEVKEDKQIFTPTPSTYSTLMYYTERDPFSGKEIFVEKNLKKERKTERDYDRKEK